MPTIRVLTWMSRWLLASFRLPRGSHSFTFPDPFPIPRFSTRVVQTSDQEIRTWSSFDEYPVDYVLRCITLRGAYHLSRYHYFIFLHPSFCSSAHLLYATWICIFWKCLIPIALNSRHENLFVPLVSCISWINGVINLQFSKKYPRSIDQNWMI